MMATARAPACGGRAGPGGPDEGAEVRAIIAGCGRVGAACAARLSADGHEVAVIDQAERAFRRLPPGFAGTTVPGVVFDRATLLRAGVDRADAFIAVTNGDNSNIVAARTARERFGVQQVVARIYDPARAAIYERYGVTTIAAARWTTDAILGALLPSTAAPVGIGDGDGDVVLLAVDLPADGGPWEVEALARQGRWVVAAVSRDGRTAVPVPRQLVQGGERVHLAAHREAVEEARGLAGALAAAPPAGGRPAGRR
jgi:trk system potassium uptake protein